jgi:hypothetical protein
VGDARAPFLVLAHHRSGSNLLNDVLQAHPFVECLNEPFSMHTPFFREADLQCWTAADHEPGRLHRAMPEGSGLQAFLQGLREYLQCSREGRVIGFKETALFGKLGWMQALVPGLKVIFLQRDPRAIVSSVLRSGLIEFWDYRGLVPPAFRRCFGPLALPHWATGSPEERAALTAMSVAVRYELARRELPQVDHVALRLDDLVQLPEQTLALLWRFLGVPPHPGPLQFLRGRQNASRGDAFSSFREPAVALEGWRRHLSGAELAAIETVWHGVPLPALDEPLEIKLG